MEYVPNGMVSTLHRFPHIASASHFNVDSSHYLGSIGILGGLFFLFMVAVCCVIFRFELRNKKHTLSIGKHLIARPHWRTVAVVTYLVLVGLCAVSCGVSWRLAVRGTNNISSDLEKVHSLAIQLEEGAGFVVVAGSELLQELAGGSSSCPNLTAIATEFNNTFVPSAEEFSTNSKDLPEKLDNIKPRLRKILRYIQATLILPCAIVMSVALVGSATALCNSELLFRITKVAGLASIVFCGLFVAGEVMFTVISSDLCYHADANVLGLVDKFADNRTYEIARFYSTCEGNNGLKDPLVRAMGYLQDTGIAVANLTGSCDIDLLGEIEYRLLVAQMVIDLLEQQSDCSALNPLWVSLIHHNACDDVVPGVSWLWIAQAACMILFTLGIGLSAKVIYSIRRSQIHVDYSDALLYGTFTRSDAVVQPVATAPRDEQFMQ